ncbi:MAG: respiratory nitrate reductase subunit gamma [Thiothrix sp.]
MGARRFLVDRVRYISAPSDHLMLALLIAIGMSGLMMSFVSHTVPLSQGVLWWHVDVWFLR